MLSGVLLLLLQLLCVCVCFLGGWGVGCIWVVLLGGGGGAVVLGLHLGSFAGGGGGGVVCLSSDKDGIWRAATYGTGNGVTCCVFHLSVE